MALAINANSVAKGIDPRTFTLMGFGGAGPLHSVALADMIQAKDVISPSPRRGASSARSWSAAISARVSSCAPTCRTAR